MVARRFRLRLLISMTTRVSFLFLSLFLFSSFANAAWIYVDDSGVKSYRKIVYVNTAGVVVRKPLTGLKAAGSVAITALGFSVPLVSFANPVLTPSVVAVASLNAPFDWISITGIMGAVLIMFVLSFGAMVLYKQVSTA